MRPRFLTGRGIPLSQFAGSPPLDSSKAQDPTCGPRVRHILPSPLALPSQVPSSLSAAISYSGATYSRLPRCPPSPAWLPAGLLGSILALDRGSRLVGKPFTWGFR